MALLPELTDHVISFIGEDKKTQASCSLVCRAWVPRSRSYLFRSVELPNPSVSEFLGFISACENDEDATIPMLLAQHLRRLCFTGQTSIWDGFRFNVEVLPRILHLLPRIDRVSITSSLLIGCHEKLDAASIRLKELTITDTPLVSETSEAFLQLLSIFSQVDNLSVSSLVRDVDQSVTAMFPVLAPGHPDLPSQLQLSCLTLINHGVYSFFPCITTLVQRVQSVHTLSDVRLQCNDARDVVAVGALLSHPSIVVRALSVDLAYGTRPMFQHLAPHDPPVWHQLNIHATQLLSQLNFVTHLELIKAGEQYLVDQFLSATSLITDGPEALECVTFFCWIAPEFQQIMACLRCMVTEFVELRSALSWKPRLRKVRWLWGTDMEHAQFAPRRTVLDTFIESKLWGMQRGILEFGIWDNEDTTLGGWLRRV